MKSPICPICGRSTLIQDCRDITYTYKGESLIISDATGDFCTVCNEGIFDTEEWKRIDDLLGVFNKKVNASRVDPVFVEKVRKKLKLDQQEAAKIFGGGVNAFSRYENGKTKPPVALVKLLKLLNRHPELLREIRA